ncbi:MAG: SPOR domain-containing protein [Hyphomicrobiales bacterium]|nr:SPOR domain-containing protein [Hyphomicrobiales bacterium]
MQYSRLFEPARLTKALLIGLAICLATVSSADAGKRKVRRSHSAHHVARSNDDGGIASSSRYAAYVVDDKTGKVLYARNENELRHPASLTKMMTLYLLFEDLEKRRVSMGTRFTVSAHAASQAPSKLGFRPGQTISAEDAIRALVTKSANDVAVTIAENLGGSEAAFARRMTATARRIGMSRSTFYNASGLPNSSQYTTAHDMVVLGRALQERFPNQYRFFATRSFDWGGQTIGNHNRLLYRLDGIDGIKTGYTEASGFNLVSSLRRDNRHLVAAVMGGSSARQRDDHMASLLTRYVGSASAGAKVSTVLRGSGRSADASDDDADGSFDVASADEPAPLPPPAPPAKADTPVEPQAFVAVERPEAAKAPSEPIRLGPEKAPRIAKSDVTPLERGSSEDTSSADHGAAVAMARAILLPQTLQPPATPAPAAEQRVARLEPEAAPAPSLATAKISMAEVAALTTASIPPRRTVEAAAPPQTTASTRSGWLIQIGAYDGEKAAREALAAARDKVGAKLSRAEPFTESVGGGSSRLWRARFAGFKDQSAADDACKALKRKKVACLAMRQ